MGRKYAHCLFRLAQLKSITFTDVNVEINTCFRSIFHCYTNVTLTNLILKCYHSTWCCPKRILLNFFCGILKEMFSTILMLLFYIKK